MPKFQMSKNSPLNKDPSLFNALIFIKGDNCLQISDAYQPEGNFIRDGNKATFRVTESIKLKCQNDAKEASIALKDDRGLLAYANIGPVRFGDMIELYASDIFTVEEYEATKAEHNNLSNPILHGG
jgi:phosphoribosylformylglycinamidine (FGAM) synthase PurS component